MKILRCLLDTSVPEESECAKCCLHCYEKEICECKCHRIDEWKTEERIMENCAYCTEW